MENTQPLPTDHPRDAKLAGLSLIAGPGLLMLANAVDPGGSDEAAARLPEIAADPGRYLVAAYLLVLAAWAFVPGLLWLWRALEGPRLTLGQVGTGLVLIGTVTSSAFFGFGVYEYEAATSGLSASEMSRLVDDAEASAAAIPLILVFLVGIVIGGLLLAWALWRRRIAPGWAAGAIALGTVLNLLADGAVMSAGAYAIQLVGFGSIGLTLLRAPTRQASPSGSSRPASAGA